MSRLKSLTGKGAGAGRRRRDREKSRVDVEWSPDDAGEFDADELLEFMTVEPRDVRADPLFKARLRSELWQFVRARLGVPRWKNGVLRALPPATKH